MNDFVLKIQSPWNHLCLIIAHISSVVFHISVPSVEGRDSHGPDIIGVREARSDSGSYAMVVVRHPSPFRILQTSGFFNQSRGKSISHSNSALFSIFTGGCFVPVPRQEIVVAFVTQIKSGDVHNPHTERTITINGVFLEISVHFVGVCIISYVLKYPNPWLESTFG